MPSGRGQSQSVPSPVHDPSIRLVTIWLPCRPVWLCVTFARCSWRRSPKVARRRCWDARQVGKSTLVRDLAANEYQARFFNLDDELTANAARSDATGFVADISGPAVIDEIQRAPALLLAIKQRLDQDQARGQFLPTGSANILTLPTVADALPGRVEYVNLWPFSQGELHDGRESFVDGLFAGRFPRISGAPVGRSGAAGMLARGGYPEVQGRTARGRSRFFSSYIASIVGPSLPR